MARCQGTTRDGDRCRREAKEGSRFCHLHEELEEGTAEGEGEPTAAEAVEWDDLLPLLGGLIAAGLLVWAMSQLGKWIPRG